MRPSLIIEVTSPKTRVNDVKTKVKQYAQAKVPYYVIADVEEVDGKRRLKLIAYRAEARPTSPWPWTNAAGPGWSRSACGWA